MTLLTNLFSSVILKFVCKPLISAAEHSHIAFFESTDIRSKIPENMFSVLLLVVDGLGINQHGDLYFQAERFLTTCSVKQ